MIKTALTWKEKQAEAQARKEAIRIQRELSLFSDRCHAYALTEQGRARAELLADAVWDDAVYNYGYESEEVA